MAAAARKPSLVMVAREQRDALDAPWGNRLKKLEERIVSNEGDSIVARWESGTTMLAHREGKQLPKGVPALMVKQLGISLREIAYRMQFAEMFATKDEVCTAVQTYPSWREMRSKALPKKPRTSKPKTTTFEEKATDAVTRLYNRLVKEAATAADKKALAQIFADVANKTIAATE